MKSLEKYLKEAATFFEEEKYEEALEIMDESVRLYPRDYDAQMNRKMLLTKLGYYDEMLESDTICEQLKLINNSNNL